MRELDVPLSVPYVGDEELAAVRRVLESGQLAQGPEVEAFEEELARDLTGAGEAVAVASGTAALELALEALGVSDGDEVVTTPFTFAATANAAIRRGARLRFADVDDDMLIDPKAVAALITDRTRAIIPVHLFGLAADVTRLGILGVPVVEDAAQAHGARLRDNAVGCLGEAGCFSFYPTKNMTTGEGGAVTTTDHSLAERIRILRNQGMKGRYEYLAVGTNRRMTDIQAAMGRVQLQKLAALTAGRRRVASWLNEALSGLDGLQLPREPNDRVHVYNQYTVLVAPEIERDRVVERLHAGGIGCAVYYPHVLADVDLYRDHPLVDSSAPLDRARDAARRVISLPVHPGVTERDVQAIATVLTKMTA
jgi:perosamine synthetase